MLGFAAVNTGNNLLYLLVSALLGFMAITGVCGHANLSRIDIDILPGSDLFAGSPGLLCLRVQRRSRHLPAFLLRIGIDRSWLSVPYLAASGAVVVELPVTCRVRGRHPVPCVTVTSCFPVNFFVRSCRYHPHQSVLVYPHPIPTVPPLHDPAGRAAELSTSVAGGDGDVRTIDDYRPGDSPRSIHWKLSARHQELKVRQFSRQGGPSVLLNPMDFNGTLEEGLGRCTYLLNSLISRNQAVGLLLGKRKIPPATGRRHQRRLLKELALYD